MLFSSQPEWADVTPTPQLEAPGEPVVRIRYDEDYEDAMGLLRSLMAKQELSDRALHLTSVVIFMNSAHLTVWEYRRCILRALNSKARWLAELEFMHEVNELNTKNYQLWNHRRAVVEVLLPSDTEERRRASLLKGETLESEHTLDKELEHIEEVFESDAKHYHAWAHRQWVAERHGCWKRELALTEEMIERDPHNNSAWNYRFYVIQSCGVSSGSLQAHVAHAIGALERGLDNEAVYAFLLGLLFRVPHRKAPQEDVAAVIQGLLTERQGGGARWVSFQATLSYSLALRLAGLEDGNLMLWTSPAFSSLPCPKALAQSALKKWEWLKMADGVRKGAYELKIKIALSTIRTLPE